MSSQRVNISWNEPYNNGKPIIDYTLYYYNTSVFLYLGKINGRYYECDVNSFNVSRYYIFGVKARNGEGYSQLSTSEEIPTVIQRIFLNKYI